MSLLALLVELGQEPKPHWFDVVVHIWLKRQAVWGLAQRLELSEILGTGRPITWPTNCLR